MNNNDFQLESMIPDNADLSFLNGNQIRNLRAHDKAIFEDHEILALFRKHCKNPEDFPLACQEFQELGMMNKIGQNEKVDQCGHTGSSMMTTTAQIIKIWCLGFHDWRKEMIS